MKNSDQAPAEITSHGQNSQEARGNEGEKLHGLALIASGSPVAMDFEDEREKALGMVVSPHKPKNLQPMLPGLLAWLNLDAEDILGIVCLPIHEQSGPLRLAMQAAVVKREGTRGTRLHLASWEMVFAVAAEIVRSRCSYPFNGSNYFEKDRYRLRLPGLAGMVEWPVEVLLAEVCGMLAAHREPVEAVIDSSIDPHERQSLREALSLAESVYAALGCTTEFPDGTRLEDQHAPKDFAEPSRLQENAWRETVASLRPWSALAVRPQAA